MKFPQPLHENVILLPQPDEEPKQQTGIFIPDELKQKPSRGLVKAVSKGYYAKDTGVFVPLDVKVGDTVYYSPFAGEKLTLENTDYLLIKQSDIKFIL